MGSGFDVPDTIPGNTPILIMSGSSWHFQLWHRDSGAQAGDSNFSNGLSVTFPAAPPVPIAGMVLIPAGMFDMGSNAASGAPYYGGSSTQPVHTVTISHDFWMGEHEVTQDEYQALMGMNPSTFVGPHLPVETLSWNDARAYCAALTVQEAASGHVPPGFEYRLPTEAEWEYACRGGTTTEFNTGQAIYCADAQFYRSNHSGIICGSNSPVVVGAFQPNAWGLHDMHGNVEEWCLDSYSSYGSSAEIDPFVTGGSSRICRGGGWRFSGRGNGSEMLRSAARATNSPSSSNRHRGFRVVLASVLVP